MATTTFNSNGPIYITEEKYNQKRQNGTLVAGQEYKIIGQEVQEKLTAGDNIIISDDNVISAEPGGAVDDVEIDGVSILVDRVANIETADFIKIEDVKVNNATVVTNKVANIDLSNYVEKESGKGLSTNNYDAAAKTKVDAIPEDPKYTDTTYSAGLNVKITDNVISSDNILDVESLPTADINTNVIYRIKENTLGTLIAKYSKANKVPGTNKAYLNIKADNVYWNDEGTWSWCFFHYDRTTYDSGYPIEVYWDTPCPSRVCKIGDRYAMISEFFKEDTNGTMVRYTDQNGVTQACYIDDWNGGLFDSYYIYKDNTWERLASKTYVDTLIAREKTRAVAKETALEDSKQAKLTAGDGISFTSVSQPQGYVTTIKVNVSEGLKVDEDGKIAIDVAALKTLLGIE